MHIVLNGLACAFLGRLEQRPHVHIKAQISKSSGHHLGTPVMPILPQLGDHHARAAAQQLGSGVDFLLELLPALG